MKKAGKPILVLLILSMIFGSCGLNKVMYSSKQVGNLDRVALVAPFVHFSPPTGLLHAAIMKDKINSISEDLDILFNDYAVMYRDSLGMFFSNFCNCEVLYGESLYSAPGYEELRMEMDNRDALFTGQNPFPLVFQAEGDINPFPDIVPFVQLKPDTILLNTVKPVIQKLCNNLGVSYVVVPYVMLAATQGDAISRGTISVVIILGLFDKDGDYIAWGNKVSYGVPISAGKIEAYPKVLDQFFVIAKSLANEALNKFLIK